MSVDVKEYRAAATLAADEYGPTIGLMGATIPSEITFFVRNGTSSAGTLDITIQISPDGTNWINNTTFTQRTTGASHEGKSPSIMAPFMRLFYDIGSSWSGTVEAYVVAPGVDSTFLN